MRAPPSRSSCRRSRTGAWRRSPACASRSSTPTTRWPWWTSRPGSWCIRVPATTRGPWSGDSWPASPTSPSWWRPGCARPTGRGSCIASTRARRACSRWPGPSRPTARWSTSWRPGPWNAGIWPWLSARWSMTGAKWRRPSAARPVRPRRWLSPPPGNRRAPPTPCWSGAAGRSRPPCSSWRSKAAGRTRSVCTWRRSGTPWSGMPVTGCPTSASDRGASSARLRAGFRPPCHGCPHRVHVALAEDLQAYLG